MPHNKNFENSDVIKHKALEYNESVYTNLQNLSNSFWFNEYILKLLVNAQNIVCKYSLKCRKYFSGPPRILSILAVPGAMTNWYERKCSTMQIT